MGWQIGPGGRLAQSHEAALRKRREAPPEVQFVSGRPPGESKDAVAARRAKSKAQRRARRANRKGKK